MSSDDRFDQSVVAADRDEATVTASGVRLDRTIDGLRTRRPTVHVDHRGRVYEVYPGLDEFWTEPLVYCYAWTIRQGTMKGWGLHRHKDDRYTLIKGTVVTMLYDARIASPTHGLVQQVVMSEQGIQQLLIPAGVWHLTVNLGESEAFLINHPTQTYIHDAPDRLLLPWNSAEIPIDIARLFPIQNRGPIQPPTTA